MLKSYAARFDSICIVDLVRCMFVDSQKSSIENIVQSYFKSMCNGTFNCIIMLCVQLLYFKIIFEFLLGIYFLIFKNIHVQTFIHISIYIHVIENSMLITINPFVCAIYMYMGKANYFRCVFLKSWRLMSCPNDMFEC